jgi:methylenetetrahydrofolate dehydrogenase (NADP+)/methenyltetrahydrofolate cyclohydrolase
VIILTAKVMDGRVVAKKVKDQVKKQVDVLKGSQIEPTLAVILVGENPGSKAYVKNQNAACSEVGIRSKNIELPTTTSQDELRRVIRELNDDRSVAGILLQLPLPSVLDEVMAVSTIDPTKDVDGMTPSNLGLLMQRAAKFVPCTPGGVMVLLDYYGIELVGRHVVLVNRSKPLGRPLSQLLLNKDATVTICHSKTKNLREICRQGDVLITAIGHRAEFTVGANMIRPGAVVVDVGISSVGGKLMGDVNFEAATQVASYVTPVPGGVGPMTIAMLLYNTVLAVCLQNGVKQQFNLDRVGSP